MLNLLRKLVLAASLGAGIASFVSVASALPVLDALAIKNAAPPTLEEVQWRGRWGWGAPGCDGCGRGARCALLLRLRPLLPRTLLSGSGACVLRLSAAGAWLSAACIRAGAWLSSADAWVSSAGTRPWLAAWRFRWGPRDLLHAALPVI